MDAVTDVLVENAQAPDEAQVVKPIPKLEKLEAWLLTRPVQAEYELTHSFGPGVYMREILMLKDTMLIGHEHKLEHFNIVLSGKALVLMDGKVEEIVGPCYFKSGPGVRKVLYILEDMRWMTVHPNVDDERDIEKLEERQVRKSETFLQFDELMAAQKLQLCAESYKPRKEKINT
jgi:hypothetical protein